MCVCIYYPSFQASIKIPVTLNGRVYMHFHTFWIITENIADQIQCKIFPYQIVLGPLGQVFTLSCRADINFVIFIITLKSTVLLWVQPAIIRHTLMLKSGSTSKYLCIKSESDQEVMTFISLKCLFKCTLDY